MDKQEPGKVERIADDLDLNVYVASGLVELIAYLDNYGRFHLWLVEHGRLH